MSIFEAHIKFLGGAIGLQIELIRIKSFEAPVSVSRDRGLRFSVPLLGAFAITSEVVE